MQQVGRAVRKASNRQMQSCGTAGLMQSSRAMRQPRRMRPRVSSFHDKRRDDRETPCYGSWYARYIGRGCSALTINDVTYCW